MALPKTKKDQFSQISYLMIEVNSFCNLKCAFCNREHLVELGWRNQKTLSVQEFKEALKVFQDCKLDTIKLEGLSEPMFHKEFDECAKVIKELFPNAFVIIATNLQYNIEKTPFEKTLPFVDMVYLSIDGTGEIYENAREGSKYPKLLRNLHWIKENIPSEVRATKLHINHVLTEYNFHQIEEMYRLKNEYNLASVRINLAQNWNEHESNTRDFNKELIEKVKEYKQDVRGIPNWDFKDCFWPYEGLIVDVFGDVRQCIINTSQKPLGNIYKDNIREIFNNSSHYKETRSCLSQNKAAANCENCDYKILAKPLKKVFGEDAINLEPRSFVKIDE